MKTSKAYSGILILSGTLIFSFSFFNTMSISAEDQYAPEYRAVNLDGSPVSLSDYKGKVLVVNLWATWCEPCRAEMPSLEKLQNVFPTNEFKIIGVSIDDSGSEAAIRQFLTSENISYEIWLDPSNKFQFLFKTIGVPESLLIDKDGKVIYRWRGAFDPLSENTINLIRSTISETSFQSPEPSIFNKGIIAGSTIAFSAGLLSFLSPCVLPLIPIYASLITGLSIQELSQSPQPTRNRLRFSVTNKGIMFVIGFSIIFILLGTTVGFLGSMFLDAAQWIERIGGIVLIVLGLHMLGILHIPKLEKQIRFDLAKMNSGKLGPLVVGMAFAAGWTPCIGPILAGILTIAASSSSMATGASLLGIYSSGLAIPFLVSAVAIDRFMIFFSKIKTKLLWIERISGILFIALGIILLTGYLTAFNNFFKV